MEVWSLKICFCFSYATDEAEETTPEGLEAPGSVQPVNSSVSSHTHGKAEVRGQLS